MTSVAEDGAEADGMNKASGEAGDKGPTGNGQATDQEDQGNDKVDAELHIQSEDDLIDGLDAWDDEENKPRRRSWDRTRGRERKNSREKEPQNREKERDRDRPHDRDRDRGRRRSRSADRGKRDSSRRDPSKSSNDIERDKARAKKDNDTKALAEKEKAIKAVLDSNDVVPPGTEEEAIQIICDKKQEEDRKRSREKERRRTPVHVRLGPRRSPRRSPARRSPRYSPRRRSPASPDRRRRSPGYEFFRTRRSGDREPSTERRELSRRRLRDRGAADRRDRERSRSRDRHRTRSPDRRRSRSYDRRGRSRSPERRRRSSRSYDRHSPRRRRSLSRSPLRSPTRARRRSPFINEITRQFSSDPMGRSVAEGPLQPGPMSALGPVAGAGPYIGPPGNMMPSAPSGLLPAPQGLGHPGPGGLAPPPMDVHPGMHPGGPMMHPGPPFGFEPAGMPGYPGPGPDFVGGGMFGQPTAGPPMGAPLGRPITPQPVPAPGQAGPPMMYPIGGPQQPSSVGLPHHVPVGSSYSPNGLRPRSPIEDRPPRREERMRTPEPPIISDFKQNEKTSLSSLLEASVSTKDSSSSAPVFKGYKPEVIRQCERALRSLPTEDPRLNMKGRFFFDPAKKLLAKDPKEYPASNSVLLRKGRTEIYWEEEFNQMTQACEPPESKLAERKRVIMLQKICQTEETTRESISVQTDHETKDFSVQVDIADLTPKEDRREVVAPPTRNDNFEERRNNFEERRGFEDRPAGRPAIGERLDWQMRETFDHGTSGIKPPLRDSEDLRWSLKANRNSNPGWRPGNSAPGLGVGVGIGGSGFPGTTNRPIVNDHAHGASGGTGMDMRGMDMMRERPDAPNRLLDARERLMEQRGIIDYRDRDRDRELDMRGEMRADMRGMDMVNDRELMMDRPMRDERRPLMPNMMDMPRGGVGGSGDFGRREPIDEYDLRNRFGEGFGRGMPMEHPMERDMNEPPMPRNRESPLPPVDDADELEIIEERVLDRDSWPRLGSNLGGQFNNMRAGGLPPVGLRNQPPVKRPFRGGRAGGFRPNF